MDNNMIKPSDFLKEHPWSCVFNQSEYETISLNVMVILKRTGDKWRELSWDEYKSERLKDGNFGAERNYFDKVVPYCVSWEKAITFSPAWAKIPGTKT
jgi:hypothetical protein